MQTSRSNSGGDHQLALPVEGDVGGELGVVLLLLVAPTAVILSTAVGGLVAPFGLVDARSGDPLELVAPDLYPRCFGRRSGRDGRPGAGAGEDRDHSDRRSSSRRPRPPTHA